MKSSEYTIYSSSQEAWDGMFLALQKATKSIYWELYIFIDDEVGQSFFDVLEQKAKAGLDVKLIVDSFGSFWLSSKRIKSLKAAGVDFHFFQAGLKGFRGWWKRFCSRTHRKVLVIDETIGFIGGVNISKETKDWLDIHVRLQGKVVRSLLRSFAKSYTLSGGKKKAVHHLLKYRYRTDHSLIDFVYDGPRKRHSPVRKKYVEALLKARERVILFSPYYFPDRKFLRALWRARKRGVRIDLLIPFRTDLRIATYVAYAWFLTLRSLGVHLHLTDKMMHGKGVIVDDEWAMIGSSNLEQASFYDLHEANVQIKDKAFVTPLKNILLRWIKGAKHIDDVQWARRGRIHRLREYISVFLYRIWHNKAYYGKPNSSRRSDTSKKS